MPGRLPIPLPTRNTVRLVLAPALVFIATSLDRGYQTDFWQHLARGRLIAREHALVSVDRSTFTVPGRPFFDNNWLSQLLYYGVYQVAGLEGVQLLNSLALAGTFALLVALCRRTSGSTGLAAAAGVGAFLGLWQTFLIRPQTFSMLLFVALYTVIEAARRRPRLFALAPVIMVLWSNVHGGFAIGLALVFAFTLGEAVDTGIRLRRGKRSAAPDSDPPHQLLPLLACLVACALATLANPYGWNVYRYAGRLSAIGVARGIEEWLPPTLHFLNGVVWAASLTLSAFVLVRSRHRPTPREVCLLVCFAAPSFFSTRMTVWWFLAAAPVLARLATGIRVFDRSSKTESPTAKGSPDRASPFAAATLATLAIAAVFSLPWLERYHPAMGWLRAAHRTESDLRGIADTLPDQTAPSRVFTRMEWANYLEWSAPGRAAVFVEGRVELYPDDVWRHYLTVSAAGEGWDRVLDDYAVDYLLLDATYHARLLERVSHSPLWSEQARAGPAVLFARRNALPAPPPSAAPRVAGLDF